MSRVAEPLLLRPSRLLEREPYILSHPDDPLSPRVTDAFGLILSSRDRAVGDFFAHVTYVLQEVRRRLAADLALASLGTLQVRVPDVQGVLDYLIQHADLIDPVLAICATAKERCAFGDERSLELYRDPEVKDEYLTLYLRCRQYGADTLNLIEELGQAAGPLLSGRSGWLLVSTDFRAPQGG